MELYGPSFHVDGYALYHYSLSKDAYSNNRIIKLFFIIETGKYNARGKTSKATR